MNYFLLIGGPGSGRGHQCKRLTDRYIGWVHLRVGDLLRHEYNNSQDTEWTVVINTINNGDLAPSVKLFNIYNITFYFLLGTYFYSHGLFFLRENN